MIIVLILAIVNAFLFGLKLLEAFGPVKDPATGAIVGFSGYSTLIYGILAVVCLVIYIVYIIRKKAEERL